MTEAGPSSRPRARSLRSGALLLWLAAAPLLLPGGPGSRVVQAQEPDTIPPLRVEPEAADTVPEDTLGPPPPTLPPLEAVGPAGWTRGVWEWDREALRRLPDLSVLHLIERIPGVVPVRADVVNQAESGAIFGAAAGAIRYVVDGFEIDPLVSPTFDPSRLPLLALDRVRVERRVTGATVRIETLSPDDPRPRSIIEAGTGDGDINLFRGMLLMPRVLGGPLALGFERLGSDGFIGGEANHLGTWAKWTWVRDSTGVQLEYRQSDMDRSGLGDGLAGVRTDWALRARSALGPVTGELYVGSSRVRDERGERGERVLREGSPHAGLRLRTALHAPFPVEGRGALRFRDHPRLPTSEVELELRAAPLPLVAVEGEAVQGRWRNGAATGRWSTRAQLGPVLGVALFGEAFGGAPPLADGAGLRLAFPDTTPIRVSRDGLRAGAQLRWGGLMLGAAALRTSADTVPGFLLAMEPAGLAAPGGDATGVEVVARLPTGWDPLSLQGWYVGMDAPARWLYLPEHHWRAGLVYHHLPLPSGNLELFVRVEHVFRGRMTVGEALDPVAPPVGPPALTEVGAYRATNLELTIRVLTLRAFLRWENILHRTLQQDLAGFPLPGQHVLYGVKWEFLN